MNLTVDSSVFVAALRRDEEKSEASFKLLERIQNGEHIAIEPYSVLVEIVSAIRRRTGSEALATRVKEDFLRINNVNFVALDKNAAEAASDIAIALNVRGMDAFLVQVAKRFNAGLVTLDCELANDAKEVIEVKSLEDLI